MDKRRVFTFEVIPSSPLAWEELVSIREEIDKISARDGTATCSTFVQLRFESRPIKDGAKCHGRIYTGKAARLLFDAVRQAGALQDEIDASPD